MFVEALDTSVLGEAMVSQTWKPKENTVVSMMFEHTAAVNRLAVPHDQSFFVSASSDGTAKVWLTKGVERNAFPRSELSPRSLSPCGLRSALTYPKQGGRLLDVAMVENSHSVATTSSNGSVHVWRVELGAGGSRHRNSQQVISVPPGASDPFQSSSRFSNLVSVSGAAVVKTIDHSEGPVMSIQHFTGDVASVLTYATQRGGVHGWDLRSAEEPFLYQIRPELGYPTSLVCSPDRNWICVGTSRGYVGLWDIRYNVMCKLWRHSAGGMIHRLACTKAAGAGAGISGTLGPSEGAYLFVASGKNEAAFWGIPEGGECLKCFRSVPMTSARGPMPNLPQLHEVAIPSHPLSPLQGPHIAPNRFKQPTVDEPAVRAIMGRITNSSASSYVVTAGTDRNIRFWDLAAPSKCFTISGLEPAQPKPVYETPPSPGLRGKLFLCYDSAVPSVQATLQSQLPVREYRGLVPPVAGFKVSPPPPSSSL
jgi:phosphoinositide-3-kinase, regulatory subunit 4